jgi:hypothetical protein
MTKILLKVETYSGYKADERPVSFAIRDRVFQVKECLDRWYGEGHAYFKVSADDGYTHIIRHHMDNDQWELIMMEKEE